MDRRPTPPAGGPPPSATTPPPKKEEAEEVDADEIVDGSRFDAYGRVINGPANRDLTPVALDDA
jgi:hypothetical protein